MALLDRPAHAHPTLGGTADPGRFVDVTGDRVALLGRETGPFELWIWPLKVLSDARLEIVGFSPGERSVVVEPGALHRTAADGDLRLRETLFASPDRRALVWLVGLTGTRTVTVELSFRCDFRPQWPAGLGGQIAGRDAGTGALLLTEELGRFAALAGGAGFELVAGPVDRALPADRVRFRARLRPSDTLAFVVAGAERAPERLGEAARLGRGQAATGLARAAPAVDAARALWRAVGDDWAREHERARAHWTAFLERTARVQSSDPRLDDAFRWSQVAIERAWAEVDGLGRGLLAGLAESGSGERPGYGWFFDGDALVAARALALSGDAEGPRAALRGAASRQREDGKMMHELVLSAGLCDWLGDYPYAYYKGLNAADFAISLDRHVRAAGDRELLHELHEPLARAVEWCASTTDEAGRMSNRAAGIAAVEAGPLSDSIESEVFLQGTWMGALAATRRLAGLLGDARLEARAAALGAAAQAGFETFWSEARGRYGFARLADGSLQDDLTAYLACPLACGFGEPARAARTLPLLNDPTLCADWGPRMFARDSAVYDPDHYNTGAVFPYLANFVVLALFRGGLTVHALQVLRSQLALWGTSGRGLVPEHLVGDRFREPARGVPHQIFSSSTIVESLLAGALGLDPDGCAGTLAVEARVPLLAERVEVHDLAVGAARGTLRVSEEREGGSTRLLVRFDALSGEPPALRAGALLPPGSAPISARALDGRALDLRADPGPSGTLRVSAREAGPAFELRYRRGPCLDLGEPRLEPDAPSRAPRIVRTEVAAGAFTWELAGPAGREAAIPLSSDVPVALDGAEHADGRITVRFPDGDGFTRRVVRAEIREP